MDYLHIRVRRDRTVEVTGDVVRTLKPGDALDVAFKDSRGNPVAVADISIETGGSPFFDVESLTDNDVRKLTDRISAEIARRARLSINRF